MGILRSGEGEEVEERAVLPKVLSMLVCALFLLVFRRLVKPVLVGNCICAFFFSNKRKLLSSRGGLSLHTSNLHLHIYTTFSIGTKTDPVTPFQFLSCILHSHHSSILVYLLIIIEYIHCTSVESSSSQA